MNTIEYDVILYSKGSIDAQIQTWQLISNGKKSKEDTKEPVKKTIYLHLQAA